MKIHFISGLPRSGSTLLIALLGQNPAFRTGLTLATLGVLQAVEFATSRENPTSLLLSEDQKWALRRSVFTALYPGEGQVVFDKNHMWCMKLPLIASLFPAAKIIACVRDVSWIMDSFERLYQSNPLETAAMYGFRAGTTVYTRVSKLAAPEGVVGMALDALKEAYYGAHRSRLMLVRYDRIATNPGAVMDEIYEFIGERNFNHDFANVAFACSEFDAAVGMPGLHSVSGPVEFKPRKTILPPHLFDKFRDDAFWQRAKLPIQDRREVA